MISKNEAEYTVCNMLLNFISATKQNAEFFSDLSDKDRAKVEKALDKYYQRLAKFQSTIVQNIAAKQLADDEQA